MIGINLPKKVQSQIDACFFYGQREFGRIGVQNSKLGLMAFCRTAQALSYDISLDGSQEKYLSIFWAKADDNIKNKLIFEHGWLPRWQYQISAEGANTYSHIANSYSKNYIANMSDNELDNYITNLKKVGLCYSKNKSCNHLGKDLPKEYILVTLQSPNSIYMQDNSSRLFGSNVKKGLLGYVDLAQEVINYIEKFSLSIPIVFKQEPRDPNILEGKVVFSDKRNKILNNRSNLSLFDIFNSGRCKGFISFNSNSLNEALLWGIPSVSVDSFLWPRDMEDPPVTSDILTLDEVNKGDIDSKNISDEVKHYLKYLIEHQWTLEDFNNPLIVEKIINTMGYCNPYQVRKEILTCTKLSNNSNFYIVRAVQKSKDSFNNPNYSLNRYHNKKKLFLIVKKHIGKNVYISKKYRNYLNSKIYGKYIIKILNVKFYFRSIGRKFRKPYKDQNNYKV